MSRINSSRIMYVLKKNKIFRTLGSPIYWTFCNLSEVSPKFVCKVLYFLHFLKKLDLDIPKTYNEKIIWLKLNTYYNNPLITTCADKYQVREFIINSGCEELLNELIGVWDSAEDINWDFLPDKFVLKCNHGSGYNIICTDKRLFDINHAKKQIEKWMSEDQWKLNVETSYKGIPKKIICEKYLGTPNKPVPDDYKITCFNGIPTYVLYCTNRETGSPKFYYFNRKWELQPFTHDAINASSDLIIEKPNNLDLMFKYAEILSKSFPSVRVDLYSVENHIIFGELTFAQGGGINTILLPEADRLFGELLQLNYSG